MNNYVTIFSNGMAHFTRHLGKVKGPQKVAIPVKTASLADALGTLAVFGNVILAEPPSFQSKEDEAKTLQLDSSNVNRDLYTKLSGSEVVLTRKNGSTVKGTLTGTQEYTETHGDTVIERFKVTVLSEGKFLSVPEDDIESTAFTQEAIQQTVNKALARNFTKINPDSTLLEFTVAPLPGEEDTAAVYQFTVPFAAWQPVYQLRLKGGKCEIEASAKIDNPTDEDLKDTLFSVVTGDPNTFETDLADIRIPRRQRVNIVADEATGAVGMQDGLPSWETQVDYDDEGGLERARGGVRPKGADVAQFKRVSAAPMAAACGFGGPAGGGPVNRAVTDGAQSSEVGDFAIYTTKAPLSLGRKRSATIPLFQADAEGKVVLVYKDSQADKKRPFRAVNFKNTTKYSFGKGSCTVFNEDVYQGQVVLEATKPGEEKLLPHARENGVYVLVNAPGTNSGPKSRRTRIEITKGVVVWDTVNTCETVYRFVNSKDEAFQVQIEHTRKLGGSDTTATYAGNNGAPVTLENGYRIPANLPAKGQLEVRVHETQPVRQTVQLFDNGDYGLRWLQSNIIDVQNPPDKIVRSKKLTNVLEAAKALGEKQLALQKGKTESQTHQREQERKLKLVAAGSGSQKEEWQKELATVEKNIEKAEKTTIPALEVAVEQAQQALNDALKALTVSWVEGEDGDRAA